MKWILIILGISLGTLLEGLVLQVPFVLIVLIITVVFIPRPWLILLSIPAGLAVDSMTFRSLGVTSLFFAISLGLIFAYGKKFELQSIAFVIFSSCITTIGYLLIFGYQQFFLQLLLTLIIALICFVGVTFLQEKFIPPSKRYFV